MNSTNNQNSARFREEPSLAKEYRQTELMQMKWYMAWLTLREKITLAEAQRPA